jgi:anti-anti-sigma factor
VSHPQLRRIRGHELTLTARRSARDRRPCDPLPGTLTTVYTGSFAVAAERLTVDSAAVRLSGELDVAAVPALDSALRRVDRWAARSVLIDVADVGFVDLTIVGRLFAAHRRLESAGGGLLVVHPPGCLLRVLELLEDYELPVLY